MSLKNKNMTSTFSFDTIKNFDQHLLASVPNYDVLFESICLMSDYFIVNGKRVFDLGCSTGKLIKTLHERNSKMDVNFIGIDKSDNLLPDNDEKPGLYFSNYDLNDFSVYQYINDASLIFSIFTLQFLKREVRQSLLNRVYSALDKGGAFIMTEKVFCDIGQVQDLFTSVYYDYKKKSFTEKEILDKEVDLRKIMKPNNSDTNIEMLERAGFKKIVTFYKYLNFEGYLCIK